MCLLNYCKNFTQNPLRRSMLDTKDEVSMKKLTRNIEILAEGLIQHIYNVSEVGQVVLKFLFKNFNDVLSRLC